VSRVAVVGLGTMGGGVARRLLDTGHDVVVWNRTAEKERPLVDAGAELAESPADAARRADAVLTLLADPDALAAVSEGADGIAAGVDAETTVVEMSTVGPEAISRLARALPEGTPLLDAPVLGSTSEIEAGALKIFVGGPEELVERWSPLFSTLGTTIHVGPLGAGAAAKLVANSTLVGALGVLGEAVALADGLGLSREAAFAVLAGTPIGPQAERRRPAIESGDYPKRFSLRLGVKDATLVTDAAAAGGVEARLAEAARSWFEDADAAGFGERDYSAVIAFILGEAANRG
jgi:3-hydroxyisobutyrate dehydrogenase-like beta-hydroxyacid dehydrogenase